MQCTGEFPPLSPTPLRLTDILSNLQKTNYLWATLLREFTTSCGPFWSVRLPTLRQIISATRDSHIASVRFPTLGHTFSGPKVVGPGAARNNVTSPELPKCDSHIGQYFRVYLQLAYDE